LRNLYRTNQLAVETKAIIMSILRGILVEIQGIQHMMETYKVVAFIVTVKLVEKRVNRNVGMVIVVKVITQ